ncbi:MAG: hypothetical protein HY268_15770 [Deltaproteobacteria bacterium]|nr:hypothetical protein [Deltaproteobacteria bacterium]
MIEEYLRQIDELLSASPAVNDVEVIRRTLRDTEWEQVLHYRYRVFLTDGSLVEMSERLVERRGIVTTTKYRYHWQDGKGQLIKRWDNAPHHPTIGTFPDHLHDGAENQDVSYTARIAHAGYSY